MGENRRCSGLLRSLLEYDGTEDDLPLDVGGLGPPPPLSIICTNTFAGNGGESDGV